jgi:hypothetical protein
MTHTTKQQYSHLLTGKKKTGEASHVGPSTDASWQLH